VPELSSEGVANSSDGLYTLVTLVQDGVQVAGLAEEFVPEDNIVHGYSSTADRTLQAVFMPC